MDDLVRDLQQSIARMLEPAARRNDAQARREQQRRKQIVERWYDWAQEFFCDAVGLLMGGPAFALSFSFYFGRAASRKNPRRFSWPRASPQAGEFEPRFERIFMLSILIPQVRGARYP